MTRESGTASSSLLSTAAPPLQLPGARTRLAPAHSSTHLTAQAPLQRIQLAPSLGSPTAPASTRRRRRLEPAL